MTPPFDRWQFPAHWAGYALALLAVALGMPERASAAKLGEPCGQLADWSARCDGDLACEVRTLSEGGHVGVCVAGESGRACGGVLDVACPEGEYCALPRGAACGASDAMGVCTPRPAVCTKEYRPVCGCDDRTYANACAAAAAGVSIAREGACGGCRDDRDCPSGRCESVMSCLAVGCGPSPGRICRSCGDGSLLACRRAPEPCPSGQVREIVDGCYGRCVDRSTCQPRGPSCSYGGRRYEVGASFPSADGCNSCFCGEDGRVGCTKRACACDYSDPRRSWVSRSPEQCSAIRFLCVEGTQPFFDACGCGCVAGPPRPLGCKVAGCSGQLCVPAGASGVSTCEWREEYACYRDARCEAQPNGQCGWTPTRALSECIDEARGVF